MDSKPKLNCIVCKKEVGNIEWSPSEVHPYDALCFQTYGHYGSTIFDPMSKPDYLNIVVCDLCIMKNLDHVHGTGKKDLEDNADMLLDTLERHG